MPESPLVNTPAFEYAESMAAFRVHHTAISVRDLESSIAFYGFFSFRVVFVWEASDDSLTIVHLRNEGGDFLELVCYASAHADGPPPGVGNNLDQVGVKHLALVTSDPAAVRREIMERNLGEVTDLTHGRTQVKLFSCVTPMDTGLRSFLTTVWSIPRIRLACARRHACSLASKQGPSYEYR